MAGEITVNETITIGGKHIKLVYLYAIAGAAGLGYVAYRWTQTRAPAGSNSPDPGATQGGTGGPDGSPSTIGGGNNTYTGTAPADGDPRSNAEWTKRAVSNMEAAGFSAMFASVTIGKWLAGTALTSQEEEAINVAVSQTGQPPVGGPYPIRKQTGGSGGTAGKLPPPVLNPVTTTANPWVPLSWSAVPKAVRYIITAVGNGNPGVWPVGNVTKERYWQGGPATNTYTVRAVAADGSASDPSNPITVTYTVKK